MNPKRLLRHWGLISLFMLTSCLLGLLSLRSCLQERARQAKTRVQAADIPLQEGEFIKFSPNFAKRNQIQSTQVSEREISPVLIVSGQASFNPRYVATVGPRISGRIKQIYKFAGDQVQAGEVLATLESAELGKAQTEVLKLRAREATALADARRERQLAKAQVSSQREAEIAEASAVAARAERLAAEKAVSALGGEVVHERAPLGILYLRSPLKGRIVYFDVQIGEVLESTHTAFEIADLQHMWVTLNVFEHDLPYLQEGDGVEVSKQSEPESLIRGHIARIEEVVDKDTHSAIVRVEIPNQPTQPNFLRANQAVKAKIFTSKRAKKVLSIPLTAVSHIDGQTIVFVKKGEYLVEIRKLTIGEANNEFVEVLKGLNASEEIITNGVFALKSEIFR